MEQHDECKKRFKIQTFASLFLFKTENASHKLKLLFFSFKKQIYTNAPMTNDIILNA